MKRAVQIFCAAALLSVSFTVLSQQGDLEVQNAVKRRSEERLAEIERQSKALSGDILRSERDLRVARSTITAKRKVAADIERETRRISTEINADTRAAEKLESTLAALKLDYGKMVYAAWKEHKTMDATLFLLSSRDFNDASRRIYFIRRHNSAREKKGSQIDSMNRSLKVEIERLALKKAEMAELKAQSDKLLAGLAKEEERYQSALKTLGGDRKKLEAEAARERSKIAAAQREINRIMARQAQTAKGTSLSEADIALSGRFDENKGRLPWPTGAPGLILHHFGKERSADGIESDFKGLIIAAASGSDVRAVFEGTVSGIYDLGQYDKCVMVRSGEYVVGYGNIASPAVKSDDKVTTGQSLGSLGNSDNPDRHRVILVMQRGEVVLDPEEWLR